MTHVKICGLTDPDLVRFAAREGADWIGFNFVPGSPRRVTREVWKALGVATRADLDTANTYAAADKLLIDAKPPKDAPYSGGHGQVFDWAILEGWQPAAPWMLAGGLTPDNVASAIAATGAPAVDVSSGVERVRGLKDRELVRAFIRAAKQP